MGRAQICGSVFFVIGSAVFIAAAETPYSSGSAWLFLTGSVFLLYESVPILRSTQDMWALPHALFGAVMVSVIACFEPFTHDAGDWTFWSASVTLCLALVWEVLERTLEHYKIWPSWMLPPENRYSWPVDVWLAVAVHLLLQWPRVTRHALNAYPTTMFSAATAAWFISVVVCRALRVSNKQYAGTSSTEL